MKNIIVVVGGGAAGMMAAGRAAECGAKVTLLEKTDSLGNKLLITGKDRCNFTNTAPLKEFIGKFAESSPPCFLADSRLSGRAKARRGDEIRPSAESRHSAESRLSGRGSGRGSGKKGNFLYPAFYNFFSEDLRELFKKLNVPSKEERGGRVFPLSDKSEDIQSALIHYIKRSSVKILTGENVKEIVRRSKSVCSVKTKSNETIKCDSVILATGGMSYPGTGSTGDGYRIAQKLGHTIVKLRPALVPLDTVEKWSGELQGLTLENVSVAAKDNNGKKICEEFGDMLFTHFGVSGPIILSMSKKIGEHLSQRDPSGEKGKVFLHIDLKPALSFEKLDLRVQRDFAKHSNKAFKNALDDLLPQSLVPVIIRLSLIPENKPVHSITREERLNLVKLLKDLRLEVSRVHPIEEAIITSGGVALEEVDNHTMESKIVKGLYFAGEILDLDAPTGGYNLQMAFSTGRLAGEIAAK